MAVRVLLGKGCRKALSQHHVLLASGMEQLAPDNSRSTWPAGVRVTPVLWRLIGR
jgi:hypothetical protein